MIDELCKGGNSDPQALIQRCMANENPHNNFCQHDEMPLATCCERFQSLVDVTDRLGINFVLEEIRDCIQSSSDDRISSKDPTHQLKRSEASDMEAKQAGLGIVFFTNSNNGRHAVCKQEIHDQFAHDVDQHPGSTDEVHCRLENWKFDVRHHQKSQEQHQAWGHSFPTTGSGTEEEQAKAEVSKGNQAKAQPPKGDQKDHWCSDCGRKNQCWSCECPHKTREDGTPTKNERCCAGGEESDTENKTKGNAFPQTEEDAADDGWEDWLQLPCAHQGNTGGWNTKPGDDHQKCEK